MEPDGRLTSLVFRPLSELFIVYSDGRDTLASGFPTLSNRGLTLKLTRLFRF